MFVSIVTTRCPDNPLYRVAQKWHRFWYVTFCIVTYNVTITSHSTRVAVESLSFRMVIGKVR